MISEAIIPSLKFVASGIAGYALNHTLNFIKEKIKYRDLRACFGEVVHDADDIRLCVPLWTSKDVNRDETRYLKQDSFGYSEPLYGPNEVFNRNDVRATAYVVNLFGKYFSEQVEYTNDREPTDWNNKTVILIGGLIANLHARYYLDKKIPDLARKVAHFIEIEETAESGQRCVIYDPLEKRRYASDDAVDYGVICRYENVFSAKGTSYVFVVGGIHEESTEEACLLLNRNWKEFRDLPGEAIAIVFEMDRARAGTGRIILKQSA